MKPASVKQLVTEMTRTVIGPPMKEAGFRRRGRTFWRDDGVTFQLIKIEMSSFGTSQKGTVRVFLAVFWHEIERALGNSSLGKMPPPIYKCTFQADLARLSGFPSYGWPVNLTSDLQPLGMDLLSRLKKFGIPWLEDRSDITHVLDQRRYMFRCPDGSYTSKELVTPWAIAVFNYKLGNIEETKALLSRGIKNGHADRAKPIAKRLGIKL